jgi:hypothetical protein
MFSKRIALVIAGLIVLMTGCTSNSFFTTKLFEHNTSTSMFMSYEKFSGTKTKTMTIDEPSEVDVDITTESGSLDLTITDKDGNSYYAGSDIPTSNFSVKLDKAGEYEIKAEADNHKGSCEITWNAQKPE